MTLELGPYAVLSFFFSSHVPNVRVVSSHYLHKHRWGAKDFHVSQRRCAKEKGFQKVSIISSYFRFLTLFFYPVQTYEKNLRNFQLKVVSFSCKEFSTNLNNTEEGPSNFGHADFYPSRFLRF